MPGCALDRLDMIASVRTFQVLPTDGTRRHSSAVVLQPAGSYGIEHMCTLGTFRVPRRGDVIFKLRR
jgi:hypothetical protein